MMKLKRYLLIFSVSFIVTLTTMATTWNGTTWSAGAPTNAVDAVIASSVTPGAFTCAKPDHQFQRVAHHKHWRYGYCCAQYHQQWQRSYGYGNHSVQQEYQHFAAFR